MVGWLFDGCQVSMATDNSHVFPIENQGFHWNFHYYLFILKAICLDVKRPSALTACWIPEVHKAWLPKRIFQNLHSETFQPQTTNWTVVVPFRSLTIIVVRKRVGRFTAFFGTYMTRSGSCGVFFRPKWLTFGQPDSPWTGFFVSSCWSLRQSFQPLALFRINKPPRFTTKTMTFMCPLEMGWCMMHVPRCFGMLRADCNCHSDTL